jgi:hypothetical protein
MVFDGRIDGIDGKCRTVFPDGVISGKAEYDISANFESRTLRYSKQRRKTSDAFRRDPIGQPAMGSSESPFMKQIRLRLT